MGEPLQTRRRILSVVPTAVLAGCSTLDSETGDVDDPEPTSTETATTAQGDCSLKHNILDDNREHQIVDRYEFDQLSSTAQQYFEEALENPDSNYEVEGTDQPAPEYEYTDVVTKYEIVYDGTVYILGTWTGAGCRVDD